MNQIFNEIEAFRIAVEMERTGRQFYRSVAGITQNPLALELLDRLALQEEKHMEIFKQMYDAAVIRADNGQAQETYDGETQAVLSAIASDIVFPGGAMAGIVNRSFENMKDVLYSGIASEKDAILFYSELLLSEKDGVRAEALRAIVNEERRHLAELQQMLTQQYDGSDKL